MLHSHLHAGRHRVGIRVYLHDPHVIRVRRRVTIEGVQSWLLGLDDVRATCSKYFLNSSRLPGLILWVPMKMNGAVMASSRVRCPAGFGA